MYQFVIKGTPKEIMHEISEWAFADFDLQRGEAEQAHRSELEHLMELDGITEEDTKDIYE